MASSFTFSSDRPAEVSARVHLFRIALFLAGVVAVDRFAGGLAHYAFGRVQTGEGGGQINGSLEHSSSADVLIFGNSRAKHHVDPRTLAQELALSTYNMGCNGQGIYYHYLLESLALQRGARPNIFVLQVEPDNLYLANKERVVLFAPFIGECPEVREVLQTTPHFTLKTKCSTWRFNSMLFSIASNLGEETSDAAGGYRPLPRRAIAAQTPTASSGPAPAVAEDVLDCYRKFIRKAQAQKIEVVLFTGPRLDRDEQFEQVGKEALLQLVEEEQVRYLVLDEKQYPVFQKPELYYDQSHLSGEGAQILSTILAQRLRLEFTPPSGTPSDPSAIPPMLPLARLPRTEFEENPESNPLRDNMVRPAAFNR